MIVTVTPNPSIDRTISVATLEHGEVNRADASRIDPGGKGVNVARALTANGTEALAVLPSGGPEGRLMTELLNAAGVLHHGVPVAGTLRMNVAVVEPDGTTTKVNEPGPVFSPSDSNALLAAAVAHAVRDGWVVGCGSLPPGAPVDLLGQLVTRLRAAGVRVAIDSSGAPLAAAVAARPDLIKPNHEELEELVGRSLPTIGDVIHAAHDLVDQGISMVVVSLGGAGAVMVDEHRVAQASATIATPLSTVGAGDCLLAGVLHRLCAGGSAAEALADGVRWGAAAVALPGSRVPSPSDLDLATVHTYPQIAETQALA